MGLDLGAIQAGNGLVCHSTYLASIYSRSLTLGALATPLLEAVHFEGASLRLQTNARFAKMFDEKPAPSSRFGIRGIPTLIAVKPGGDVARKSGIIEIVGLPRQLHNE